MNRGSGDELRHRVPKALSVRRARTGEDLARLMIDHVAHGIHRYDRTYHEIRVAHAYAGRPQTAFHCVTHAEYLAYSRSSTSANVAFGDIGAGCVFTSCMSSFGVWSNFRIAYREVINDGCRHNWNNSYSRLNALTMSLQVLHDAGCRIEPEGAAAGEQNCVDLLDRVDRIQQICLACPGR